mmetsp:Transcript_15364/g.20554  ORF Transcript_15364/g.20554 Transcript_15364/m.20554 type:complete len:168 (-) Transcript_15364:1282-1785(-)
MSSSPAKTFALTARRYQQSHNGALQSKKVLRNTHRLISTSRVKQHHDQSGKSKVNGELLAMVTLAAASVSLSNESFFDSADKSARCSGIATAVSSGSHDTSHDFLLKKFSVLKGRDNEVRYGTSIVDRHVFFHKLDHHSLNLAAYIVVESLCLISLCIFDRFFPSLQ